jgi:hypothetical protein
LLLAAIVTNATTERQHYRLFTIHKIPTLKILDFVKVKQSEREKAKRLATSAAGAALESDVQIEARDAKSNKSKTFNPGEGTSAKEAFVANFTPEQKAAIKEMIANASTPSEIERIEECVKRGIYPGGETLAGEDNNHEERASKRSRTLVDPSTL